MIKKVTLTVAAILIITGSIILGLSLYNRYQVKGDLLLPGLDGTVSVTRDEKGMAYVRASSLDDALKGWGFVAAQDRFFQMTLLKLMSSGRVSELAGKAARDLDIRMRTLGFRRLAEKQAAILNDDNRNFLQAYADGVNAFIQHHENDLPLEFKLAGLEVEPWTIEDILAIGFFMSYGTSANINHEILAAMIIDAVGEKRFRQVEPLNINPDEQETQPVTVPVKHAAPMSFNFSLDKRLLSYLNEIPLKLGSNNWAISGEKTGTGKAILAGDPHLQTSLLPGPVYPCGLIFPGHRIVGAGVPGTPLMITRRSNDMAYSVTNAYGDTQDLYIETLDPADPTRYREGAVSRPFTEQREVVKIRTKKGLSEESIIITSTTRGPVISKVIPGYQTSRVVTFRWAMAETMQADLGFRKLLLAQTVQELQGVVKNMTIINLNFVAADSQGSIMWQTSGRIPVRLGRKGDIPTVVTGPGDDWIGFIPVERMPSALNPDKEWVGTCNHKTVREGYPWYYSSYFSSSYRYARLKQRIETAAQYKVSTSWSIQRDRYNGFAADVAPVLARILLSRKDTWYMGDIIKRWNHEDRKEDTAPALFQVLVKHLVRNIFEDELGREVTAVLLGNEYFWKERFARMIREGSSPWFDNRNTATIEGLEELVFQAARETEQELETITGKKSYLVTWGDLHRMLYLHPLGRKGWARTILGKGPVAMDGSGETLYRARYGYSDTYLVNYSSAARMVADFGDSDKVAAVISSGVCERFLHPHNLDQVGPYQDGSYRYWWFSDDAIKAHARHTYRLVPQAP